jgi:hypothetical protein
LYLLERARERQRDREREEEAEEEEEEAYLDALLRITVLPGEALIFFFFFLSLVLYFLQRRNPKVFYRNPLSLYSILGGIIFFMNFLRSLVDIARQRIP